jgi:hypothetical protein
VSGYQWTYRVPAKEVRVGRVILTPDDTEYEVLEVRSPWVGVIRFTVRTAGHPGEFPLLVGRNEPLRIGNAPRA